MVKDFLNVNTVKNNVYCKKYYLLKRLKYDIPMKNDALLIYGVGCTIDYIKSNDKAKQLPDKCIKALDNELIF